MNLQVRLFQNLTALFHAEGVQLVGGPVGNACGIHQTDFPAGQKQPDLHEVPSGAGDAAHENAVFAQEGVYQAGLARVWGSVEHYQREAAQVFLAAEALEDFRNLFANGDNPLAPGIVIRVGLLFGKVYVQLQPGGHVLHLFVQFLNLFRERSRKQAVGVFQFCTVRAVNHVGHGFRLDQVHLAVQKGPAGKFTRFCQTNALYLADGLNQFPHDQRVSVGVKL